MIEVRFAGENLVYQARARRKGGCGGNSAAPERSAGATCGERSRTKRKRSVVRIRLVKSSDFVQEGQHTKTFVRKGRRWLVHSNGIEGFWSFAKHGLYNYRGVSRSMFPLYLKEMEYRFNHRRGNMLNLLIRLYFGGNST